MAGSGGEDHRPRLKEDFVARRGYWNQFWDGLLALDPVFFEAYLQLSSVPWEHGPLGPKVKELIYLAIDSATTHLYEPGLRQHIRNAIGHGATVAEIMEVFELTSMIGIHTCTLGVPVLLEELATLGIEPPQLTLDDHRLRLKEDFVARRGYWNQSWDGLLALDPVFFEAYLQLSSVPWEHGPLGPKVKELIYLAIDSATTHLYEPGLRQHIRNAIGHGATVAEIMEVFELTSMIGIHTCTLGVPVLLEELDQPRSAT